MNILEFVGDVNGNISHIAVSYTHLRAHETKANLVCRLLLEKKKKNKKTKNLTRGKAIKIKRAEREIKTDKR